MRRRRQVVWQSADYLSTAERAGTNWTLLSSTYSWYVNYGWRRGVVVSGVRRMNEVNARRARLVPGWVTIFGRVYHLGV